MSDSLAPGEPRTSAVVTDCWNRIGVRGDRSCPELTTHVHCRNCPVYAAGAAALLNKEAPANYLAEWTSHFARPKPAEDIETRSVVIFRTASEWLALPASVVIEVANLLPIHTLPHRQNGAVLGLASVRGELLVCVSLSHLVGVKPLAAVSRERHAAFPRLLVIRRGDIRAVCPVDEVHGIHRFHPGELREVPTTVAHGPVAYSTAVLTWRSHSIGILDAELLFYSLKRNLG